MLLVDSREKGNLPTKLLKLDHVEKGTCNAGDYIIGTKDVANPVVIERTKLNDFIGKIISGRIDDQIEKCKDVSSDVILLLEGMHERPYTKLSYKSIIAKMASISRRGVQIICTKNSTESYEFIKKIHRMYQDGNIDKSKLRVKRRNMSLEDQAIYMLMGINGIGEMNAKRILQKHGSIADFISISAYGIHEITDPIEQKAYDVLSFNIKNKT